ncbi:transcriptional regulator, TetR family [Carnobacterium iners]|uniref:Transcriptional regulator, TetR family n=1 Tax=Carnobacterium iners TaxID=1073423 RepID=A0A1X7NJE0_9LACT|nr:TetR/AcrR family transcriptional regulator [Carnobacterium iners]SEK65358.1 transcriptional regulator, TetR family [Carnobacterium iners]SMH37542.1 transcriptional regulator, TetR family [Carnobacterium iners]
MDSILILFEKRIRDNKSLTPKMIDILKASLELFSCKGYSNTSTKDIAKAANVAEGTIFKHFGSKENLLYATLIPLLKHTLAQEWKDQLALVKQNIEAYPFPIFLREVLEEKTTYAGDNIKVFKILYMEFIYQEDMRKNLMTLIPKDIVKEINEVLDYYKKKKQVVNLPNKELFRFLAGTLMTFVITVELIPATEEEKALEMENMITFLIKGLTPEAIT